MRRALDFVGEAHGAADLAELRTFLPAALHGLIRSDYASYNEIDDMGRVRAALVTPELQPEQIERWGHYARQNPLVLRFARTRDGRAYRFSDVMTREQLDRLELFSEFYEPLGLRHQIAFALPSPAELTIGLALTRGGRDYAERDRELLNLVRPHLIQVYRNVQERERAAALIEALRAGVEEESTALAVLDRDKVAFASAAAERWLRALGWRPSRPAPRELLASARGGRSWEPLLLSADGRAVLVRRLAGPRQGSAVLVFEPRRSGLAASTLRGLGLTRREAEVLDALAAGASTEDVAAKLGMSRRTIYKHTQRIHAKLGSHDRAQAIATALAAERAAEL
jgi:DNA-binding CsgD family transcriptional regulator